MGIHAFKLAGLDVRLRCGINLTQVKMMEVRHGVGYLFDIRLLLNSFPKGKSINFRLEGDFFGIWSWRWQFFYFHGLCASLVRNNIGKEWWSDFQKESDREEGKLLVKVSNWDEMGDMEHDECSIHHRLMELRRRNHQRKK